MKVSKTLDNVMLLVSTFFLSGSHDITTHQSPPEPRVSLLWMYFVSRTMRAIFYAGFAAKLSLEFLLASPQYYHSTHISSNGALVRFFNPVYASRLSLLSAIALFSVTSYLNINHPNLVLFKRHRRRKASSSVDSEAIDYDSDDSQDASEARRSWKTYASEGLGWFGSWWVGVGNGDWFGFVGHNGRGDKTIVPSIILEQMTVNRNRDDGFDDGGGVTMEEIITD